MALQKTVTLQGNISVVDAIHEVSNVNIKRIGMAQIRVSSYLNAEEQTAKNSFRTSGHRVKGEDFTAYFDTVDGNKTILEKAQDYLLAKVAEYSGATVL